MPKEPYGRWGVRDVAARPPATERNRNMKAMRLLCLTLSFVGLTAAGCQPIDWPGGTGKHKPPAQDSPEGLAAEAERLKTDNADLRRRLGEEQVRVETAREMLGRANDTIKAQHAEAKRDADRDAATIKKLEADKAKLRGDLEALAAALKKLRDGLKTRSDARVDLLGRLEQAHRAVEELKLLRKADELHVKDVRDQITRIGKLAETLRAEVAKRDRRIDALEVRLFGKATPKPQPPPVWPAAKTATRPAATTQAQGTVKINARLIMLRADMGRIDAGSALGVKLGMKLGLYRDGKFVAFFQVAEVDLETAGGFILARKTDPKVGDRVISLPKP